VTRYRQAFGRWGELTAVEYLQARGYQIVARNARTPFGELDIVARKDGETVFVEVKTRASDAYGLPEDSVTSEKQAHLVAAAQEFLEANPALQGDWRIDVIAIRRAPGKPAEITHFENAIG
jgi:putative endonuclease